MELINSLREEPRDADVAARLAANDRAFLVELAQFFVSSPSLVLDLCLNDRGIVVSHVAALLSGQPQAAAMIDVVLQNAHALSTHQSGCIAVCRLYDAASMEQKCRFNLFVARHFVELACHLFGNYVVQRMMSHMDEASEKIIREALQPVDDVISIASTKSGSHVLESILAVAMAEYQQQATSAASGAPPARPGPGSRTSHHSSPPSVDGSMASCRSRVSNTASGQRTGGDSAVDASSTMGPGSNNGSGVAANSTSSATASSSSTGGRQNPILLPSSLCRVLLDERAVMALSHDRFGNYVVQRALRFGNTMPYMDDLRDFIRNRVPDLVTGSSFEINLVKAAHMVKTTPKAGNPGSQGGGLAVGHHQPHGHTTRPHVNAHRGGGGGGSAEGEPATATQRRQPPHTSSSSTGHRSSQPTGTYVADGHRGARHQYADGGGGAPAPAVLGQPRRNRRSEGDHDQPTTAAPASSPAPGMPDHGSMAGWSQPAAAGHHNGGRSARHSTAPFSAPRAEGDNSADGDRFSNWRRDEHTTSATKPPTQRRHNQPPRVVGGGRSGVSDEVASA